MQVYLDKIPHFVRNKFFITGLAFVLWMLFFDQHNIIDQFRLKHQYNKLKIEKAYYAQQIIEIKQTKNDLFTTKESLEKFAREEYLMKRDDEVLYVIVEE